MSKHVEVTDNDLNSFLAGPGNNKEYGRQKKQFYTDFLKYISNVLKDQRPIEEILEDRSGFQTHLQR